MTCPSGKYLGNDWGGWGSSGTCVTCTEDSHCPGGTVCNTGGLITGGKHVCEVPKDDGLWWCPEQDDNFWNFEIDSGTRGSYGFSQVYQMKINGKACSYDWATEEFELKMQGNPKLETLILSFSYDDFKDINLGSFKAERLDSGLCAPIPALSFGIFGFGAALYLCFAIENFDITNELMKGELHLQLTAKVNLVVTKYEYDLFTKLLMSFAIDESNENVDLDALPTTAPVTYTLSACPNSCSLLTIGSAESCLTGDLSCTSCDLDVCRTYMADVNILEEGMEAVAPSSPTGPASSSGIFGTPSSSGISALNGLIALTSAIIVALMCVKG